ncbi:hypothetical protein VPH35_131591 [Triticum aestivum]
MAPICRMVCYNYTPGEYLFRIFSLVIFYLMTCSPRPPKPQATLPLPLRVLLVVAPARHRQGSAARWRGAWQGEKGGKIGEAEFFRKDGVVGDMDGYLNYLSLEYDFVSDTNPTWVSSRSMLQI